MMALLGPMMRNLRLLILLSCLSGCASIVGRSMSQEGCECGRMFVGVKGDFKQIACRDNALLTAGAIVDTPLSFVADVMFLPFDLYKVAVSKYGSCDNCRNIPGGCCPEMKQLQIRQDVGAPMETAPLNE